MSGLTRVRRKGRLALASGLDHDDDLDVTAGGREAPFRRNALLAGPARARPRSLRRVGGDALQRGRAER